MFDFSKGVSIWMFFGLLIPFVNIVILAAIIYHIIK